MHPNPVYHDADTAKNIAFARERGFGVLAANGDAGPLMSHVPFLLNDAGDIAYLHLVRSNPIARALAEPIKVKLAVVGGDTYISPDWYKVDDQVPTWNYLALELEGPVRKMEREGLISLLDDLSAQNEAKLAPKKPWHRDKMDAEKFDKMVNAIVGFEMEILAWRPTAKLGQNKPDAVREKAAAALDATGRRAMAHLMKGFGTR